MDLIEEIGKSIPRTDGRETVHGVVVGENLRPTFDYTVAASTEPDDKLWSAWNARAAFRVSGRDAYIYEVISEGDEYGPTVLTYRFQLH